MTYLIIINVVICLVLIGTFFMHSNNYTNINSEIKRINYSLHGIQENWNYFNVLENIQEEISDTRQQLKQNNNDTGLIVIKEKLEDIKEEIHALTGRYSYNLSDIHSEIEKINSEVSNLDDGFGKDVLFALQNIIDEIKEIKSPI